MFDATTSQYQGPTDDYQFALSADDFAAILAALNATTSTDAE